MRLLCAKQLESINKYSLKKILDGQEVRLRIRLGDCGTQRHKFYDCNTENGDSAPETTNMVSKKKILTNLKNKNHSCR